VTFDRKEYMRSYMREYMQKHRSEGKYKESRQSMRDRQARHRAARGLVNRQVSWPFWGCDGEGAGRGEDHIYWILRCGPHVLEHGGEDLSTSDCLRFLADLGAEQHKALYVSFYFGYDTTMILRGLPERSMRQFLAPSGSCFHCTHGRDSHFPQGGCFTDGCECEQYSPGGQCTFYPVVDGRQSWRPIIVSQQHMALSVKWQGLPGIVINDTAGFFQTSFMKTLSLWEIGRPELQRHLQKMKDRRSEFTPGEDLRAIAQYNELECWLLVKLMGKLRRACVELDLVPKRWRGAGYLASAMLEKGGVPKRTELDIPPQVSVLGEYGYFGGRFETFRIGTARHVHSYDIASAYPHAYTKLPCLREGHGSWHEVSFRRRTTDVGIWPVHLRTSPKADLYMGLFPHRDEKGRITYPANLDGAYWGPEIVSAIDMVRFHPELYRSTRVQLPGKGWEWRQGCDCPPPGDFTKGYYAARLRLGKSSAGIILKLALNALYGKAAQRVGQPPWANIVWAGLITAMTRARLLDAASSVGPLNVISFQTDGLYSTRAGRFRAVDAPAKAELGDWEHEAADELFLAQSGVYAVRHGDDWTCHSRGFPFKAMLAALPELQRRWPKERWGLVVDLPERDQFVTMRLAVDRGKPETAGTWAPQPRVIDFSANADKRVLLPNGRTLALYGPRDDDRQSRPYDARVVALVTDLLNRAAEALVSPDMELVAG
jgi:hypothetical protein